MLPFNFAAKYPSSSKAKKTVFLAHRKKCAKKALDRKVIIQMVAYVSTC